MLVNIILSRILCMRVQYTFCKGQYSQIFVHILDSICCLQHTWKEGYMVMTACVLYLIFGFVLFLLLLFFPPPLPKNKSLGPATTYS